MPNVYYEIADPLVEKYGGKYFARYNCPTSNNDKIVIDDFKIVMASERIWRQDGGTVSFIKHRYEDTKTAIVDPVEFTLIQLKSNPL